MVTLHNGKILWRFWDEFFGWGWHSPDWETVIYDCDLELMEKNGQREEERHAPQT